MLWHNGGFPGFSADFRLLPDDDMAMAILASREDQSSAARQVVAGAVSEIVFGR